MPPSKKVPGLNPGCTCTAFRQLPPETCVTNWSEISYEVWEQLMLAFSWHAHGSKCRRSCLQFLKWRVGVDTCYLCRYLHPPTFNDISYHTGSIMSLHSDHHTCFESDYCNSLLTGINKLCYPNFPGTLNMLLQLAALQIWLSKVKSHFRVSTCCSCTNRCEPSDPQHKPVSCSHLMLKVIECWLFFTLSSGVSGPKSSGMLCRGFL